MTSRLAHYASRAQLVIVAAVVVAAGTAWPGAPDRVPVHWGLDGRVDRWGGRAEGLLLLPAVLVAMAVAQRVLPRLDPGRANYPNFAGAWAAVWLAVTASLAGVYAAVLLHIHGRPLDMARVGPAALGALFVLLGAFMGKLRPNWFMGVRTPWTLSSKTSWIRTHRLAGWMLIATGVAAVAGAAAHPRVGAPVLIAGAVATTLVCTIYSYAVWREAADKVPPAGSSPAE